MEDSLMAERSAPSPQAEAGDSTARTSAAADQRSAATAPERVTAPSADDPPATKLLAYLSVMDDLRANEEAKLKLLLQVGDLTTQLSSQKDDARDIYFYLNKKCDDSYNIIAQLEEQLAAEQQDREDCEKVYEGRILELERQSKAEQERSRQTISVLEDKLMSLERFHETQQLLERQLLEAKETLATERRETAARLDELDMQHTLTRDKMRKDKEQALVDLRAEMNQSLESRMPAAVQKTLMINNLIKRELQQQSATAIDLLDRDRQIQQHAKEMKLELALAQDQDKELTAKMAAYQRSIKSLNDQIARDSETREQAKRDFIAKIHQKDAEIAMLRHQLQSQEQRLAEAADMQHLREVWSFLSEAFEAHSGPQVQIQRQLPLPPEWAHQQERLLIHLIRSLLLRYPSRFQDVLGLSSTELSATWRGARQEESVAAPGGGGPQSQSDGSLSFPILSPQSPARSSESAPQLSRHPGSSGTPSKGSLRLASSESMQAFRDIFLPHGMPSAEDSFVVTRIGPANKNHPSPSPGKPTHRAFRMTSDADSQSVASATTAASTVSQVSSRTSASHSLSQTGSFGIRGPRQVTQLNMRDLVSDKLLRSTGVSDNGLVLSGVGASSHSRKNKEKIQLNLTKVGGMGSHDALLSPASSVSMSPRFAGADGRVATGDWETEIDSLSMDDDV